MSYYMRYFVADRRGESFAELRQALQSVDANYDLPVDGDAAEFRWGDGIYGQLEINVPGDKLFADEIEEQVESAQGDGQGQIERVVEVLRSANATVCLQVLYQDRDDDATLERIDPLWNWLFANRSGMLQVDGEGYYDKDGLIAEAE